MQIEKSWPDSSKKQLGKHRWMYATKSYTNLQNSKCNAHLTIFDYSQAQTGCTIKETLKKKNCVSGEGTQCADNLPRTDFIKKVREKVYLIL